MAPDVCTLYNGACFIRIMKEPYNKTNLSYATALHQPLNFDSECIPISKCFRAKYMINKKAISLCLKVSFYRMATQKVVTCLC